MIGNDIVDLAETKLKSNWQRPRFLEKLFTAHEQQLIKNSDDSFLMVWRLWSMKEAAYKLYTQLHPSRFYNPRGFGCYIQNETGIVKFKDFECNVKTQMTTNYVLSEARLTPSKMTSKVIKFKTNNPKRQTEVTKVALVSELSKQYQIAKADLKFQKSEYGIPNVLVNSEKIHVSLSHHGYFSAYAVS